MATAIKWFSAAFGAAFGAGAGVTAIVAGAAIGDIIYDSLPVSNVITPAEAACYADCAIADGSWDGARGAMKTIKVSRAKNEDGSPGFQSSVRGLKSAPLADVPDGSVLRGVAE